LSALSGTERRAEARATEQVLVELLGLQRELLELSYVRRADALERAREAVRRVGDMASAEGLLARAASELGSSSDFDRVLLSELDGRQLRPLALWSRTDPAGAEMVLAELRDEPIRLEYPLLECEVVSDRAARLVDVAQAAARTPRALAERLGWSSYAVAVLSAGAGAGADTIGVLHADRGRPARALDGVDLEVVATYANGLSGAFERAVLRHTLTLHRAELASAVQWMGSRVERLSDLAGVAAGGSRGGPSFSAEARLLHSLTPRELEVLRLLTHGLTNLAIANALVVREGTIKYHVKNILRKLGATSRADAVSRYVRATAEDGPR
jgi:LuxR family transcriptional regulator, regulator of acetate metabolism